MVTGASELTVMLFPISHSLVYISANLKPLVKVLPLLRDLKITSLDIVPMTKLKGIYEASIQEILLWLTLELSPLVIAARPFLIVGQLRNSCRAPFSYYVIF